MARAASIRQALLALEVGESWRGQKASKVSVLRSTAYAVSRDSDRKYSVYAPMGKAPVITRIK